MSKLNVIKWVVTFVALLLNIFVYFYPNILNNADQCQWHKFDDNYKRVSSKYGIIDNLPDSIAELLILNFPSLRDEASVESDSLYDDSKNIKDIHMLAFGDPQINGNWPLTKYIKRLDNYGNDYYLGHIYNTMKTRLDPSHVIVMGDLFSSQWIHDSEFYNRTNRFAERLFNRPIEYKRNVVETFLNHQDYDWIKWMNDEKEMDPVVRFNSRVYKDVYDWFYEDKKTPNFQNPLFINLTGNHDIGYSGDATWQHMARFHHLFGQNNYLINYNKGTPEEWRIIVLDSLTLEGPALEADFVNFTWSFLKGIEEKENPSFKGSTILLTHIPFYKEAGLCADGPEHRYYINNEREPYKNGLLRSQNHLAYNVSQKVLDIVFPNSDKEGIILTGHDHVGCDSWYNSVDGEWKAEKEKKNSEKESIREIVVRSMMGDFDGTTGILTGHFNSEDSKWGFEFSYCKFAVQHWWWASKVATLICILLHSISFIFAL